MAITFNSPFSDYYKGVADSFKGVTFNPVTPAVINTTKDFLQSGSKNQGPHANNPGGVTPVTTYPLGTTKGDEYLIPKEPNLFVNNSDVPSLSEGLPLYGPLNQYGLIGDSNLGPINISNPQPSYLDNDTFMSDNMDLTYNPTGIDTADDRFRREAAANLVRDTGNNSNPNRNPNTNPSGRSGGGSAVASAVPSAPVLRTRTFPFTSRTPSGTVYAPDLSAYNDSSLFNYAGPGGLAEYTYGQGLRTDGADYSIFGSPADAANPYFAGQFKEPQGPADAAINMPAVELPEGVQPVTPTEVSADVSMPGFVGGGNPMVGGSLPSDLTYQQTIDEMGIFGPNNPPPSTLFPSPGQATANEQNTIAGNIAGTPDNSMMANQAAADAAMGDRLGYPVISAPDNSMMDNQAAADEAMGNRMGYPLTVPTTQQKMDMLQARANQVYDNMTAEEKRDGLFIEPVYSVSKDTMKLGIPDIFATNNENVSSTGNLINRTPPERSLFKPDEIDIPTPPFRPEGVEGVDFYQDVTGNYFAMEDDLGTQPLGPNVRGSRRNETLFSDGPNVRGSRRNPTLFSEGPSVRGTRGDTVPADIPDFLDYDISRDNANYEDAVNARDAQLQEQLDSRPRYEREETEELTSSRMEYLDNAMSAINAKYEGSKTDASAEAELKEILNATLNAFGNPAGRENATLAREQQDMRQASATPFVPSYAREIEGTDMGESLFQGVDTSPTNTVYPGENSIPFNPSNPIDQLVLQKTAQEAQIARAKYDNVPARAETGGTPISIFNVPAREPVNMNQIRPMVARTENNMTVPVMRDSAMDRRYGGPMRFGR